MTKREMFVAIANVAEVAANAEMVDFLNHQIELLDNRKSSPRKGLTATQKANLGVKELIVNALAESGDKMTVGEILTCEGLGEYTSQKISALLRQLVLDGRVVKTMEGKKAYFGIAEA